MPRASLEKLHVADEGVARPFLKWVGGKRQILPFIRNHLPAVFGHYHEPFLGGGAVFFDLHPERATISDINAELIDTYIVVQSHVEALIRALKKHVHDERSYYEVRALNPADLSPVQRAARMIYLNKTGYNGLYRVNRSGGFNVPFGRHINPNFCDAKNLRLASERLCGVKIQCGSFENVLDSVRRGDLVYFDPPYIPLSRSSSFVAYQKRGFGMDNQERLAEVFEELTRRGVSVLLSNSDVPWMRERYAAFRLHSIHAMRHVNSMASSRGPVGELVVTNF